MHDGITYTRWQSFALHEALQQSSSELGLVTFTPSASDVHSVGHIFTLTDLLLTSSQPSDLVYNLL